MNLVFIQNQMGVGGSETHSQTLARALTGRGHRVLAISQGGETTGAMVEAGARHVRLPVQVMGSRGSGWRHRYHPKEWLRRPVDRWVVDRTVRLARDHGVAVVHTHQPHPSRIGFEVARRLGVPSVITVHGIAASESPDTLCLPAYHGALRVIAVSEEVRDHLVERFGLDAERIRIIRNGVETDRFVPPSETILSGNHGPRILHASALGDHKSRAVEAALGATEILCDEFSSLELWIAGDGSLRERFEEEADVINRRAGRRVVRFLGAVADMAQLIESMKDL